MDKVTEQELKNRGGDIFAWTGGHTMHFFVFLPESEENLEFMLKTFRNLFEPKTFAEADVARERTRIRNEIGRANDDIEKRKRFKLVEAVYGENNHVTGTLGSRKDIAEITAGDMQNFHAGRFNAANSRLILTTPDIEKVKDVEDKVRLAFADLPVCVAIARRYTTYSPAELRDDHGTEQIYFNYLLPFRDLLPGDEYIAHFYWKYVNAKIVTSLMHELGAYDAECAAIYSPGKPGFLSIVGDLAPDDAHEIAPRIAKVIGDTASCLDPQVFAMIKTGFDNSFAAGEFEWLASKNSIDIGNEIVNFGYVGDFEEERRKYAAITPDALRAFAEKHMQDVAPSLYAEGDLSRLHSRAEFETMLRQAMQKPAPVAGAAPDL